MSRDDARSYGKCGWCRAVTHGVKFRVDLPGKYPFRGFCSEGCRDEWEALGRPKGSKGDYLSGRYAK